MKNKNDLEKLAEKCTMYLRDNFDVKKIFIIGSITTGYIHDKSDIDIVVEGLDPSLYIKALTELYDLLYPGIEINLIPFEDAYKSLQLKTLKKGRLIYG